MKIKFGKRIIGEKDSCIIIAEAGVNHNNDINKAKELIRKAAKAGADAIKFQHYSAGKLVTKTAPRFWDWDGEEKKDGTQYDSYSILGKLPNEAFYELFDYCKEHGIEFLSTPFDEENADFLDELGVKAYKIASCDLTNIPFLKYVAKKNKPMFLATGTSNIGEIHEALNAIKSTGNNQIVLLHCTLCYPTKFEDVNLRMMQTMKQIFKEHPIGLSDHSLGIEVPIAAAALGAKVIEKHYTIDKKLKLSADHWLSVDDTELKQLVDGVKNVLSSLGDNVKQKIACEDLTFKYARRSLVANKDIPKGTKLTEALITCKRPGTGVAPKFYDVFLGKVTTKDIKEDELLDWSHITKN